jgi:hypothetical protein
MKKQVKKPIALAILAVITLYVVFVGFHKEGLLAPIPLSEKIPVRTLNTIHETESAPSWAFQRSILPKDEQHSWKILAILILAFLIPSFIIIILCLMKYYRRRDCYKGEGKEEEREKLLQNNESLVPELRGTVICMEEMEGKLRTEVQNRTNSVTADYERRAQLQNEVGSMEILMLKAKERSYIPFQDAVSIIPITNTPAFSVHLFLFLHVFPIIRGENCDYVVFQRLKQ